MTIHTEKFWERKPKRTKPYRYYGNPFLDKLAYNRPAYKNSNQLELDLGEIRKKELTPILENIKKIGNNKNQKDNKKMKTKKVITMAVLSIFSLSILLPACSKKEQAKTTRLYTKQEALKMYHKDQIPEKDGINDNQTKTRSEAIAEYQNRKNKGTQIQEKDHPNDNRHKLADIYINQDFTTKDVLIMTASLFGTYGACFGVAYYISFVYATVTMPLMSCLLLLPLYIASLTVLPNIR